MAFVYIVRCSDGSYYTGSTVDLSYRIAQHNAGEGAEYTRQRRPVELIWFSEFERIADAFGWEKRIQGWSRAKKQMLIDGRYDELAGWSARARSAQRERDASSR
ncbi:MAG: nuclease family protein [Agromyces sp.]|nr:nuclease family protein [Agromyces sp.]